MTQTVETTEATTEATATDGQFVTVRIGGQLFGLPIKTVHEVFVPSRITPVPLVAQAIDGMLNLRGRIVTMIDMRKLLGLPDAGTPVKMAAGIEHKGEAYGLIIDEVGEVLALDKSKVEANPVNLDANWAELVSGVCRIAGELMLILDVEQVFSRMSASLAA